MGSEQYIDSKGNSDYYKLHLQQKDRAPTEALFRNSKI